MPWRRVFSVLAAPLIAVLTAVDAHAHKGSPWHDPGRAVALGVNSALLQPTAEGVPTSFTFRYPVRSNVLSCSVGEQHTAMVFPDSALSDGLVTHDEVIATAQGPVYGEALVVRFTITRGGYYHFLFGPGPSTSILVLEAPPNGTISLETASGAPVPFVIPATAGDVHLVKDPRPGASGFAGWIGVMFAEARSVYDSLGIARDALPPLDSTRLRRIAERLTEFGYLSSTSNPLPSGSGFAPFLASLNGMGVLAFATARLTPGTYTFSYPRRSTGLVVDMTRSVVLQVTADEAYAGGLGDETRVLARAEYPATNLAPSLTFEVNRTGYYHLMYGPGDCGFLLHLDPDASLPVFLTAAGGGTVSFFMKLGGINTVLWDASAANIQTRKQTYFPCKLADEPTFRLLGIMPDVSVPLSSSVAQQVASVWSATPPEYQHRGGGKFLSGGSASTLRVSLGGTANSGDGSSFSDTCGIEGSLTAFDYLRRRFIQVAEFQRVDGQLLGGGDLRVSARATALVGGQPTTVQIEMARMQGIVRYSIRDAASNEMLAGGIGEVNRAAFDLLIEHE